MALLSQKRKMRADESPDMLAMVRALVGPGLIFTGWQIMSASYVAGICLAYAGFVVALIEIIWEPALIRRPFQIQVVCIGFLVFFFDLFTINVVLTRAPIVVNSEWVEPSHVIASTGGIVWNPFFAELDVMFTNTQTDGTYDDFNVLVRPDRPVAAISQLSNLYDVSFEDRYGVSMHSWIEDSENPIRNLEFVATDAGYKVHCAHIPANASLRIVMAIVELKKAIPRPPTVQSILPETIFVVPTITDKDGSKSNYWYGTKGYSGRFLTPSSPTKITVDGTYLGSRRLRTIKKDIPIGIPAVFP